MNEENTKAGSKYDPTLSDKIFWRHIIKDRLINFRLYDDALQLEEVKE